VTPYRRRRRTTVDGEPRKRVPKGVATKLTRGKYSGAHSGHGGALGDDGDELEWPGHMGAVVAVLRPKLEKEKMVAVIQAKLS
jgi:hypothetical protein